MGGLTARAYPVRRMNRTRIVFVGLLLCLLVCGFQCDVPKRRAIAALTGSSHGEKPDYRTIEALFAGVAELLKSSGFRGGTQQQPSSYRLPGGREFADGFWLPPSIGCTVEIIRKSVSVDFYEWESPRHSGHFPTTDEQRASVRALAHEIETYLRARLPASYEIHVSFHDHAA